MVLSCISEMEQLTLKSKYREIISETYACFGFPAIPVDFKLVEASEEEKLEQEKLMEQRRLEEEELARQAIIDFQNREKEKKELRFQRAC